MSAILTEKQFDAQWSQIIEQDKSCRQEAVGRGDQVKATFLAGCGWNQRKIAGRLGKSHVWVGNLLRFGRFLVTNGYQAPALTERRFRGYWEASDGEEEERFEEVSRRMKEDCLLSDDKPHQTANSGNNEWYTPEEYIELARNVMGTIDLDPASNAIANKTVRAKKYFDQHSNGLEQPWHGSVWLNPPYAARDVKMFSEKLIGEIDAGRVRQAIVLVNNASDTEWFTALSGKCNAMCLKTKRVAFINKNGEPITGAVQGQVFLYFGKDRDKFLKVFCVEGNVWSILKVKKCQKASTIGTKKSRSPITAKATSK